MCVKENIMLAMGQRSAPGTNTRKVNWNPDMRLYNIVFYTDSPIGP